MNSKPNVSEQKCKAAILCVFMSDTSLKTNVTAVRKIYIYVYVSLCGY